MKSSKAEILEYVKNFADRAHGLQVRKYSGDRYIVHPARVMGTVAEYNNDVSVLAAALLHDVLEDTPVTQAEIGAALAPVMTNAQVEKALKLVVDLTDVFVKGAYPGMNRRKRKEKEAERLGMTSPEAQTIKYADLLDNVTDIVQHDVDFATVFVGEAKAMLATMRHGDQKLRKRVMTVVDQSLEEIKAGTRLRPL